MEKLGVLKTTFEKINEVGGVVLLFCRTLYRIAVTSLLTFSAHLLIVCSGSEFILARRKEAGFAGRFVPSLSVCGHQSKVQRQCYEVICV